MKKKAVAVLLAAVTAVVLAACGNSQLSNDYVTVKMYKGLEVPKAVESEITDEYVQSIIESNLDGTAEETEITDRPAQSGDWVNIDYAGYDQDGVQFDGGTAEGADLELGSGSFIGAEGDYAGFEDQVIGHSTGEEFDIHVQFPENYGGDMSGKVATFHIVLNKIYERNVPELTDEWVASNSTESSTVEEYQKEIRSQLEAYNEDMIESDLMSSIQDSLLAQIEMKKYPEGAVEEQIEQANAYYTQIAELYGMTLDELIETNFQMTTDEFNEKVKESAQQAVQLDEAVKLIAEKEKLTPDEEEYMEKITEYATEAGVDDVDAYMEENGEDTLKTAVLREKVLGYLVEECVQVEESADGQ